MLIGRFVVEKTYARLGREHGVSEERVRQIVANTVKRLRPDGHPLAAPDLRRAESPEVPRAKRSASPSFAMPAWMSVW
jgi:hypothetical protein